MRQVVAPKGWAIVEPVGQDGSSRRYTRIEKGGHTAVHMDCSDGTTPGHKIEDFVLIANWLNDIGLKAPDIYEQGKYYLIIEDFGELTFKKALATHDPVELYALAADVLTHLRAQKDIPSLPGYYQNNVHKGHRRIIDWYAPLVRRMENPPELVQEYLDAWAQIEKNMKPAGNGFVHADFHVENLMWLPEQTGIQRCGILDFQGAMSGPAEYDLGNLLEDVRIDVPFDIQNRYLVKDEAFKTRYRILTTQFHCRVIGQFIKMAARDHKTGYLQYIPRVQMLIKRALQDPLLKPLKKFLENNNISLTDKPDLRDVRTLVSPDAF